MDARSRSRLIACALALAAPRAAWADSDGTSKAPAHGPKAEVTLKDGTLLKGELLEQKPEYVVLRTEAATRIFNTATITSVERTREPIVPEAATEGNTVSEVLGGREGTHLGIAGGGIYIPGQYSTVAPLVSATVEQGLPVGELHVTGSFFAGSVQGTAYQAGFLLLEPRLYFAGVVGIGLGPILGYGAFHPGTGFGGLHMTPLAVRFGGAEASISFFTIALFSNGDLEPGGTLELSYFF